MCYCCGGGTGNKYINKQSQALRNDIFLVLFLLFDVLLLWLWLFVAFLIDFVVVVVDVCFLFAFCFVFVLVVDFVPPLLGCLVSNATINYFSPFHHINFYSSVLRQ